MSNSPSLYSEYGSTRRAGHAATRSSRRLPEARSAESYVAMSAAKRTGSLLRSPVAKRSPSCEGLCTGSPTVLLVACVILHGGWWRSGSHKERLFRKSSQIKLPPPPLPPNLMKMQVTSLVKRAYLRHQHTAARWVCCWCTPTNDIRALTFTPRE